MRAKNNPPPIAAIFVWVIQTMSTRNPAIADRSEGPFLFIFFLFLFFCFLFLFFFFSFLFFSFLFFSFHFHFSFIFQFFHILFSFFFHFLHFFIFHVFPFFLSFSSPPEPLLFLHRKKTSRSEEKKSFEVTMLAWRDSLLGQRSVAGRIDNPFERGEPDQVQDVDALVSCWILQLWFEQHTTDPKVRLPLLMSHRVVFRGPRAIVSLLVMFSYVRLLSCMYSPCLRLFPTYLRNLRMFSFVPSGNVALRHSGLGLLDWGVLLDLLSRIVL